MSGISLDRLDAAVEVVELDGLEIGARVREPDYHELVWVQDGSSATSPAITTPASTPTHSPPRPPRSRAR